MQGLWTIHANNAKINSDIKKKKWLILLEDHAVLAHALFVV